MAEEPAPPATLPSNVVEACEALSAAQLRALAAHAEALATHRVQETRLDTDSDEESSDDEREPRPDDVPAGASVTVKEINDNRYRYWQWRDGDKVKSKYIGPVDSTE